jgi:hypothetical protein
MKNLLSNLKLDWFLAGVFIGMAIGLILTKVR